MGSEEKRYALLIDSDNVSAKYIDTIFDELADRGMVTVRRIYGDWARSVNGWNRVNRILHFIFHFRIFRAHGCCIIDVSVTLPTQESSCQNQHHTKSR